MIESLLGFIAGVATTIVTFIIFRHQQWGTLVSKSRLDWINDFRREVADIVLPLQLKSKQDENKSTNDSTSVEPINDILANAYRSKSILMMKLNKMTSERRFETNRLLEELKGIDYHNLDNPSEMSEIILNLSKSILEVEWRRVKNEAKGRMLK
jgi:hypothetical protein